jgi:hypothetical protein
VEREHLYTIKLETVREHCQVRRASDLAQGGVTSGDEEGLRLMEVDTADRTVVLVEAVDEGSHAVVPQLDHAAVQGCQDPWPLGVEGQALDAV